MEIKDSPAVTAAPQPQHRKHGVLDIRIMQGIGGLQLAGAVVNSVNITDPQWTRVGLVMALHDDGVLLRFDDKGKRKTILVPWPSLAFITLEE